jgi:hypothetical protein
LSGTPYRGDDKRGDGNDNDNDNDNDQARMEQVCVLCHAANFRGSVIVRRAQHPRGRRPHGIETI